MAAGIDSRSLMRRFTSVAEEAFREGVSRPILMSEDGELISPGDQATCEEMKALNRQTWSVFANHLSILIGQEQMEAIGKRYKINLAAIWENGEAMLPEHVDLFSTGVSRIFTRTIKQCPRNRPIKELTAEQLSKRFEQRTVFPPIDVCVKPEEITGDPLHFSRVFFHNQQKMDKEVQILLSNVHELTFDKWLERLAKCLVCRDLEEKQILPVPMGDGRIGCYKIYKRITTGDGLMAFAFKPLGAETTLKPLIVFRSTQFALAHEDAIESIINDVEVNIGSIGYDAAKELLQELMEDPKFCPLDSKVDIAGFSLGGTHAQRFLADFWKRVDLATFYNDPSVDRDLASQFAEQINRVVPDDEPLPFRIRIYRMEGDFADALGDVHLGLGVKHPDMVQLYRWIPEDPFYSPPKAHNSRIFDVEEPRGRFEQVAFDQLSSHLDNANRGWLIAWSESARQWGAPLSKAVLYSMRYSLDWGGYLSGSPMLRRSHPNSEYS